MITRLVECYHCGSTNLVKHGFTKNHKQRYFCQDCQRSSREAPQPKGYTEEEREEILRAYEERSSLRGVARNTVTQWLREKNNAPGIDHHVSGAERKALVRIG